MARGAGLAKPGEYSPRRGLANSEKVRFHGEDCGPADAYIHVEGDNAAVDDDAEDLITARGGGSMPPQWLIINAIYCVVTLGVVLLSSTAFFYMTLWLTALWLMMSWPVALWSMALASLCS